MRGLQHPKMRHAKMESLHTRIVVSAESNQENEVLRVEMLQNVTSLLVTGGKGYENLGNPL